MREVLPQTRFVGRLLERHFEILYESCTQDDENISKVCSPHKEDDIFEKSLTCKKLLKIFIKNA